jgi:hypothetical protein
MSKSKNGSLKSSKQPIDYEEFIAGLINDPVKLKEFLRKVTGPPRRTLEGKEREQTLLLLAMMEPYEVSNNQISWTSCYMIGDKDYHVTSLHGFEDIVDLMLPDD